MLSCSYFRSFIILTQPPPPLTIHQTTHSISPPLTTNPTMPPPTPPPHPPPNPPVTHPPTPLLGLSYPDTVKKGNLSMMGFDEELEDFDRLNNCNIHCDYANPAEHAYPAILRRYLKGKTSKHMYTTERIHSEIFEQPKLLPPNTVLDIDFDRHESDFLLLTVAFLL